MHASDTRVTRLPQGSGDVKYHLGTANTFKIGDKAIHLSLLANPSHLESPSVASAFPHAHPWQLSTPL